MIYPIVAYGDPVLKKKAEEITKDYEGLAEVIENMWETMHAANGVGLAAPQIGKSIRLFVVDASPFEEDEPELADFKKVFINARILEEDGEKWPFNEGCLSIPKIREDINRHEEIVIEYYDENFKKHKETYSGMAARVIQHEYDHIEGILFVDHLSPLRKRLLSGKLSDISKGNVDVDYRMKFPVLKKR
jgi:peptide deformylase